MIQPARQLHGIIDVPEEVKQAALDRSLVLFVGSGVSKRMGLPSWRGFSEKVLNDLANRGKIDFSELQMLKNLDPRKVLSIARLIDKNNELDFTKYFKGCSISKKSDIYINLNQIPCTFVTTNYDCLLKPSNASVNTNTTTEKAGRRVYLREDLKNVHLDGIGNVIHLHGSIDEQDSMIITTSDYLTHYTDKVVQDFLRDLFSSKTVVFLGYGLDEIELLETILRHGKMDRDKYQSLKQSNRKNTESRLFAIQGFYGYELPTFNRLRDYYNESFELNLLGYSKDRNDHEAIDEILAKWAREIVARPITLSERIELMEKVIFE